MKTCSNYYPVIYKFETFFPWEDFQYTTSKGMEKTERNGGRKARRSLFLLELSHYMQRFVRFRLSTDSLILNGLISNSCVSETTALICMCEIPLARLTCPMLSLDKNTIFEVRGNLISGSVSINI